MADEMKYVSYKQAFLAMLALGGLLITIIGAMWSHEMEQNKDIQSVQRDVEHIDKDTREIKEVLKMQTQILTDTRERIIRLDEKIKK